MKLAIHQPQYLCWQGLLEKWRRADLLVLLDTVQFEKGGYQNRCRLRTPHGDRWLTVPVHAPGLLKDLRIDGDHWRGTHRKTLQWVYGSLPPDLGQVYGRPWSRLAPLAAMTMQILAKAHGVTTPTVWASEIPADAPDPTDRLIALCRWAGTDTYLTGRGGLAYLRPAAFDAAGIDVELVSGDWPPYTALDALQRVAA